MDPVKLMSLDSLVPGWMTGVSFPRKTRIFLFVATSRLALGLLSLISSGYR